MISVDHALEVIRSYRPARPTETVPLNAARGRVAARDYTSPLDFPLFDNSAMDGYAVGGPEGPWEIVGEIAAGQSTKLTLGPCEAVRIFTGAPVCARTFGVIPQEEATVQDGFLMGVVRRSAHVRFRAEEAATGKIVVRAGQRLQPPHLAGLASCGFSAVEVEKVPVTTVLTTGNEVVSPGETLSFGQIHNSNATAIQATLADWGIAAQTQHALDRLSDLQELVPRICETSDLLISTGGVSVGAHDYVRPAMEAARFEVMFHGVAVKPGKPMAFGVREDGKVWFGLPGNPFSTWVGLLVFIAAWLGHDLKREPITLAHGMGHKPGREEYVPAVRQADGQAKALEVVGSHANLAMIDAEGLLRIESSAEELQPGQIVEFLQVPWSLDA
ncbi:MAG: molybdopterin molybdotransferase MoeA [Chthonomonas sp.]|nr:molybdopterin molybdotransferase MoeA [Chthonomonas sp.]